MGKGKTLHFAPPKMSSILVLLNLTLTIFFVGLALRCHVLTYYNFGSRFTEFGHPFCRNPYDGRKKGRNVVAPIPFLSERIKQGREKSDYVPGHNRMRRRFHLSSAQNETQIINLQFCA